MALYDSIAGIYDPWSASVVEDIAFYVEEALGCDGPVVELAVGSGRIAVPIAQAASSIDEIEAVRVEYLGRKSAIKQALREVRDRETGMALNAVRERLEAAIDGREAELARAELDDGTVAAPRFLDVERDVLDDRGAPRIVDPRNGVVEGHVGQV